MKASRQSLKYFGVRYTEFFVRNGLIYVGLLIALYFSSSLLVRLGFLGYTGWLLAIFWQYFTTTYRIKDDTLILTTGTLTLTTIKLKQSELAQTLSNFRVEQTLYQKIFRTQGLQLYLKSHSTEDALEFFALSAEQLAQLQAFLAPLATTPENSDHNKEKLIEKSQAKFSTIVKTGFISTNFLTSFVALFQLYEQFPNLGRLFELLSFWSGGLVVAGVILFSLIYHYVSFAKFTLWQTPTSFIVRNNFLTTDQNTIPKDTIVGLELKRDLNRRLCQMTCVSAILANSDNDQTENRSKSYLFPLLPNAELLETLAHYFPQIPLTLFTAPKHTPKWRDRLGYLIKLGSLILGIYFILQFFLAWSSALSLIGIGLLLLAQPLLEPLTTSFSSTKDYLMFESGLLDRRTYILPRDMLASVKTTAYFNFFTSSTLTFTTTDGKVIKFLGKFEP